MPLKNGRGRYSGEHQRAAFCFDRRRVCHGLTGHTSIFSRKILRSNWYNSSYVIAKCVNYLLFAFWFEIILFSNSFVSNMDTIGDTESFGYDSISHPIVSLTLWGSDFNSLYSQTIFAEVTILSEGTSHFFITSATSLSFVSCIPCTILHNSRDK